MKFRISIGKKTLALAAAGLIVLGGGTGAVFYFGFFNGFGGEVAELRGTLSGDGDIQHEGGKAASHATDAPHEGEGTDGRSTTNDHTADGGSSSEQGQPPQHSGESTDHGNGEPQSAQLATTVHYDIPTRSSLANAVRMLMLAQSDAAYGRIPVKVSQRDAISNTQVLLQKWGPKHATRQDLEALAIYLLSGGNPRGLASLVDSIDPATKMADVVRGTRLFAMGDKEGARKALSQLEIASYSPSLGARLSLVAAALADEKDFGTQSRMLRSAASLAPGTLVEEAAYRRLLSLYFRKADPKGFEKLVHRYLRRFPKSLYISDFAATFLQAAIAFEEQRTPLPREMIEKVSRILPDGVAADILLSLGRQAADSGFRELCEYVGGDAYLSKLSTEVQRRRMKLYSMACRVVDEPDEMLAMLEKLSIDSLSGPDVRLRDDAIRLAKGVKGDSTKAEFARFFGPVLPDSDTSVLLVSAAQQLRASEELLQETLW